MQCVKRRDSNRRARQQGTCRAVHCLVGGRWARVPSGWSRGPRTGTARRVAIWLVRTEETAFRTWAEVVWTTRARRPSTRRRRRSRYGTAMRWCLFHFPLPDAKASGAHPRPAPRRSARPWAGARTARSSAQKKKKKMNVPRRKRSAARAGRCGGQRVQNLGTPPSQQHHQTHRTGNTGGMGKEKKRRICSNLLWVHVSLP